MAVLDNSKSRKKWLRASLIVGTNKVIMDGRQTVLAIDSIPAGLPP